MVERSRRTEEEDMDGKATRMVLATAALSAFALLLAAPVGAYVPEGDGVHANGVQTRVRQQAQSVEPGAIPYLSHGIGVDESQFSGQAPKVDAQHQALTTNRAAGTAVELDQAIRTAIEAVSNSERATAPLPHGSQVVLSPATEEPQSLGLTGDSAPSRTSGPEQRIGEGPSQTTYPSHVIGAGDSQWDGRSLPAAADVGSAQTVELTATSSGSDFDWESFGAGAGMAAILAAACAGVLLATRRRHTVGMS
jgi:hypothetical protein